MAFFIDSKMVHRGSCDKQNRKWEKTPQLRISDLWLIICWHIFYKFPISLQVAVLNPFSKYCWWKPIGGGWGKKREKTQRKGKLTFSRHCWYQTFHQIMRLSCFSCPMNSETIKQCFQQKYVFIIWSGFKTTQKIAWWKIQCWSARENTFEAWSSYCCTKFCNCLSRFKQPPAPPRHLPTSII